MSPIDRPTAPLARLLGLLAGTALLTSLAGQAHALVFTSGDLVISVYGNGDGSGVVTDNQASPITLQEVTTTGVTVGRLVLPQTTTASGGPISGEYGSSSEGTLQQSANGQFLTIAGYGIAASTFNANQQSFGGGTKSCIEGPSPCFPLAQTASVANTPGSAASGVATATVVPRVIALVGANGSVDTSTALTGVFNENNPRSVATVDGSTFYIAGQGNGDGTDGVFVAQRGASTATALNTAFDARTVEIVNGQVFVSVDSKLGTGQNAFIATVGTGLPAGAAALTPLPGLATGSKNSTFIGNVKLTLSNGNGNSVNGSSGSIFLSPENYFFANPTTLYVADSGNPKAGGVGDGGLQKWVFNGTKWVLEYTLSAGLLHFVSDATVCGATQVDCGTTGLIGLAGKVVGNDVELFATNATLGDEDQTYLYGIDDQLSSTTGAGESFNVLVTAAPDTNIRGVAFAPVPEPASLALYGAGLAGLGVLRRRRLPA